MDNGFWAFVGTILLLVLLAVLIFPKTDVGEIRILELEEGFVVERCIEYELIKKCSLYPNKTSQGIEPPHIFMSIGDARAARDKWEAELKDEKRKRYVE